MNKNAGFKNLKQYFAIVIAFFILIEVSIIHGIIKNKEIIKHSISSYRNSIQKDSIHLIFKPNVYHIIFDAYTGFDALQRYWSFSDTAFINNFPKKNVNIAFNAKTCKDNTLESISAIFNSKNLNIPLKFRSITIKSEIFRKLINDGSAINHFKFNGYQINNLSLFDIANKKRRWEFPWLLPKISFLDFCFYQSLLGNFYKNFLDRSKGKTNSLLINEMKDVIKLSKNKPSFTYVHLMMPHIPNNFDKQGNVIGRVTYSKDAYLEELQYCNKVMIETISLIEKYDPNAILILQSDHGSGMLS
ncbi:MAG: sulfatase-like hydrolase/transferase [Saprospiraceae bacterium]|nr:sulfatase-like hydrolase/transferase [Saprospiraceae bacterium]